MLTSTVALDCNKIRDWESFHNEFERVFGFPSFYGRNMDAWIDCMTSLNDPEDGMSEIHSLPGSVITLELKNAKQLKDRYRELYDAIIECSAFVNWRRIDVGEPPVIALSFRD